MRSHLRSSWPRGSAAAAGFILAVAVVLAAPVPPAFATGGLRVWEARDGGPADDWPTALAVSPAGTLVFVTGYRVLPDQTTDYATVAYDAVTGRRVWLRLYDGAGGSDFPWDVAVSPDGARVFVTGQSRFDYATVAYDATSGARLWVRRYDGPTGNGDVARAVTVSPDGSRVFVTGQSSFGPYFRPDYATVAYNAVTGTKIWVRRHPSTGRSFGGGEAVSASPDGTRVYVTGWSTSPVSVYEYVTIAYDAVSGAKVWLHRYHGPRHSDDATALGVSPDGARVFVTGESEGLGTNHDYATVAYDAATGAKLWSRRFNGSADGDDIPNALAVGPDGSTVFVTGESPRPTSSWDYVTIAYDAITGEQLWLSRYNGPADGEDEATALGVGPDGSQVYVTGVSPGSSLDYATVAYDATTGEKLWLRRYSGPGRHPDGATAVGVSPDGGMVFVTGDSTTAGRARDYVTIAYSTRFTVRPK